MVGIVRARVDACLCVGGSTEERYEGCREGEGGGRSRSRSVEGEQQGAEQEHEAPGERGTPSVGAESTRGRRERVGDGTRRCGARLTAEGDVYMYIL